MNVAVLGASAKPERYSYQALQLLVEKGYRVYPVHPALSDILGIKVYARLSDIPEPIHTVTVYLSAVNQEGMADDLFRCGVRRVIFNPGTEHPALADRLKRAGIDSVNACTLVLLKTGQFES